MSNKLVKQSKVSQDLLDWRCSSPGCNELFGRIDKATRTTLRIKVREKYYWILDAGLISTVCSQCGAYNEIKRKEKKIIDG